MFLSALRGCARQAAQGKGFIRTLNGMTESRALTLVSYGAIGRVIRKTAIIHTAERLADQRALLYALECNWPAQPLIIETRLSRRR